MASEEGAAGALDLKPAARQLGRDMELAVAAQDGPALPFLLERLGGH